MRNIEILNHFSGQLLDLEKDETVIRSCIDEFDKTLFVYTSECRMLSYKLGQTLDGTNSDNLALTRLIFKSQKQSQLKEISLVQMDYIQECSGVVLSFANGSMFLTESAEWKEVGEISDGILTGSWAPNQEYLAIATKAGKLVVFTPEFDVLYEADIDDGDLTFKEGDEVDPTVLDAQISWRGDSSIFVINYKINGGRKCLTRDMQNSLQVSKGPARADNQVVFSVSEAPIPTLELAVGFMPNGSLCAGFQRRLLPNGDVSPEIVFWERNGLRHGEFDLPKAVKSAETQVFQLSFNLESTVLAVHCSIDSQEQILLFCRSNWKWFCKQQVLVSAEDPIKNLSWAKKYQLCFLHQKGSVKFIEYKFDYMTSNTNYNMGDDSGYVAVVDGPAINLTPLGKFIMPPPMFEKQVLLPFVPQSIALSGHQGAAYIDKTKSIYAFNCEAEQQPPTQYDITAILSEMTGTVTQILHHGKASVLIQISGSESDSIVILELKEGGSVAKIAEHCLDKKIQRITLDANLHHGKAPAGENISNENDYYIERNSAASSGMPLSMMAFNNFNDGDDASEPSVGYIVQTMDKSVSKLTLEENFFTEDLLFTTPHLYLRMQTARVSGKEVIIGLTQTLRLYVNGHIFSNECTCFSLHENFLLFVNSTSGLMHELFIYDLNKKLPRPTGGLGGEDQPPQLASLDDTGNFNVRAVERGARIVLSNGYKTILQMPRGNLEGIQPRILLLKTVVRLIKKARFGMAFKLLRQHKLDINLIYDVDPANFLSKIDRFVKQVKKVDYLNLFVNSLNDNERSKELDFMFPQQEEDLLQKRHEQFMLKFQEEKKGAVAAAGQTLKINSICDALRTELEKVNQGNVYLLPILTTYIKKEPQELKQVLSRVQEMRRVEFENNQTAKIVPPHLNPQTMKKDIDPDALKIGSKEALEYVSWLVNPNRLFDVALTTYNFDLVTLVATQTQKDPKEYVPYLKELKSFPSTDYMKFKVHFDLKNYSKALKKLTKSNDDAHFEEAVQLIKKQRLFKAALEYYKDQPGRVAAIKTCFGEYLDQRGFLEEAGAMFLQGGDLERSQASFLRSLNVEMSLAVLAQRKLSQEDTLEVREELIEALCNASRNEQAGDLLAEAKGDQESQERAFDSYVRANSFQKAIKIAQQLNQSEKIDSILKPSLLIACDLKSNQLRQQLDTFGKRMLRLTIVQQQKRSMPGAGQFGGERNFELDSDALSMSNASESQLSQSNRSGSGRSQSSGFSETSKKSRRVVNAVKKMRKKRAVKEGSPFEEEYLIELLHEDTKITPEDKQEVKTLMQALIFFGMIAESVAIHGLIEKMIKAQLEAQCVLSVEQENFLAKEPEVKEYLFTELFSRNVKETKTKKELDEWENSKCFKH